MTARLFKDPSTQALFERDGYVVVDFLSAEQVNQIAAKFYEVYKEIPAGFSSPSFSSDDALKQKIDIYASEVFASKTEALLQDYKKLGITFLCKAPGAAGRVGAHQDWTVVDETKYCSATIWVPTIDTTELNGTMRVLPGSHKFFDEPRSTTIPVPYAGHESRIWDLMLSVSLKAGQAFILNHAVIHGSAANFSNKERLSIACGIIPRDARLMFYHRNAAGKIEKYDMPDDFFMRYHNIGERPTFGKLTAEFDYIPKPLTESKLQSLIKKYSVGVAGLTQNNKTTLSPAQPIHNKGVNLLKWVRDFVDF